MSIQALIDQHFAENTRGNNGWSPATIKEYKNAARLIKLFFSEDTIIQNITPEQFRTFKKLLMNIPRSYTNTKKYRDLTVDQILAATPQQDGKKELKWPTLSITRINQYLRYLSQLFTFAEDQGYIVKNLARKLQIPNRKKRTREVYQPDDLKKLFHSKEYLNKSFNYPWQNWLPLLGLFTGARIEEICQLHIEDVKQIEGVWCIDINDHGDSKHLKNQTSKRVVALHPVVIKAGFIKYVKSLPTEAIRIFPELKPVAHKYGHYASRWFGRYKRSCGLTDAQLKFHSFRHGVETNLKHRMVNQILIDEILGHAVRGMAGIYGKKFPPAMQLKEAIKKLDFGITFQHLY